MSELFIFSLVKVVNAFVSSISQIMLKISAKKKYASRIKEYLNPLVITGYFLFFGCTVASVFALKVVPLSMSPILDSTGYIFVTVLSLIFLKEKLKIKQVIGILVIIAGIAVYSIQM